jgi:hypothetical protein
VKPRLEALDLAGSERGKEVEEQRRSVSVAREIILPLASGFVRS